MSARVFAVNRPDSDPLGRLAKLTSIGVGVGNLATMGSGGEAAAGKSELDNTVFGQDKYELGDAQKYQPTTLENSIFGQDSYQSQAPTNALGRRLNSLRLGVKY